MGLNPGLYKLKYNCRKIVEILIHAFIIILNALYCFSILVSLFSYCLKIYFQNINGMNSQRNTIGSQMFGGNAIFMEHHVVLDFSEKGETHPVDPRAHAGAWLLPPTLMHACRL